MLGLHFLMTHHAFVILCLLSVGCITRQESAGVTSHLQKRDAGPAAPPVIAQPFFFLPENPLTLFFRHTPQSQTRPALV